MQWVNSITWPVGYERCVPQLDRFGQEVHPFIEGHWSRLCHLLQLLRHLLVLPNQLLVLYLHHTTSATLHKGLELSGKHSLLDEHAQLSTRMPLLSAHLIHSGICLALTHSVTRCEECD